MSIPGKESIKEIILALAAGIIMILQAFTAMGVHNNQTFVQGLSDNRVEIGRKIEQGVTSMIDKRELEHIQTYHKTK